VNGDGFSDVIIGARFFDNGEANEGRAFVYHGAAGGLGLTADWTAESNLAGAQFGFSVATAADVNGDGFRRLVDGLTAGRCTTGACAPSTISSRPPSSATVRGCTCR
jgi:hypothetical protein